MANTGAKLSSFPEVNDIQTGDMFPLLSGGNTNAKIDYATLADAIIAKLKSENVVQTQTNNANKLISAALAYSMNQSILQLEEDTSTEQEEKSVTAEIVTVDDADGGEAGLTLNLEPTQSGSGDPSPSNIRPITGYDSVGVTRTGKNLAGPISNHPNGARITKYTANGNWPVLNSFYKAGVYTLSFTAHSPDVDGNSNDIRLWFHRSIDQKWCKLDGSNAGSGDSTVFPYQPGGITTTPKRYVATFTLPFDCDKITLGYYRSGGYLEYSDLQLELSSTATDYEPYAGNTYNIAFPSEAGTVYGGSLDVTTGVLTVDRAQIASYNGETLPGKWISDRDVYAAGASPTTGAQVVYELATPVTYQLTPIEVTTLLGDNTIWMDAEGTIKLDYKTNAVATKGDVNDALARIKALAKITEAIAPVESSYTATQNYAIGDYLIVDYKLYKVTAAITSGATITEGTNVTATTIMAEIQALA